MPRSRAVDRRGRRAGSRGGGPKAFGFCVDLDFELVPNARLRRDRGWAVLGEFGDWQPYVSGLTLQGTGSNSPNRRQRLGPFAGGLHTGWRRSEIYNPNVRVRGGWHVPRRSTPSPTFADLDVVFSCRRPQIGGWRTLRYR